MLQVVRHRYVRESDVKTISQHSRPVKLFIVPVDLLDNVCDILFFHRVDTETVVSGVNWGGEA